MAKVRIYALARELGIPSKALLERLRDEGVAVKSHMSGIDVALADRYRREFAAIRAEESKVVEPPKEEVEAPPEEEPPVKDHDAKKQPVKDKRDGRRGRKRAGKVKDEEEEEIPRKLDRGKKKVVVDFEEETEEEIHLGSHRSFRIQTPPGPGGPRMRPPRPRLHRGERRRRRPTETHVGPAKGQKFSISTPISVRDLSAGLGIRQAEIIKKLLKMGVIATINDLLDEEQVLALAVEYEIEIDFIKKEDLEEKVLHELETEDREEDLEPRAPVVTLLGHVDHGKTSLLDKIRHTNVVAQESGGITQHIGAYSVKVGDSRVVFLDTPGHEAFTAMRARGANVTDIVVLVVAADDGVMPQTEEAIDHARAAGVPIVVALNKIDRPNAKPERVMQQLSALGLQPEDWGGNTILVKTSAITGEGIDELLEMLVLQAEMLELKANPGRPGSGTVLESMRTEGRGVVATLLVREGTLRLGDCILAGSTYGRVRAMFDDTDRRVKVAGPSTPVKVIGFSDVPEVSARFYAMKDLQTARLVATGRAKKATEASRVQRKRVTLENLAAHLSAQETKEARFIVKADVQGALEVLEKTIRDLSTQEVTTRILRAGVGAISESDVILADASNAIIIGFNVVPDERARALADEHGISIKVYQVIYQAIEDVKAAMEGLLEPDEVENVLGHAEVRQIFNISRVGTVAGCYVRDGVVRRNSLVRLTRDGVIIHEGRLASLRRVKDDVREVRDGMECGLKIEGYDDVKVGDIIEALEIVKVKKELSAPSGSSS